MRTQPVASLPESLPRPSVHVRLGVRGWLPFFCRMAPIFTKSVGDFLFYISEEGDASEAERAGAAGLRPPSAPATTAALSE